MRLSRAINEATWYSAAVAGGTGISESNVRAMTIAVSGTKVLVSQKTPYGQTTEMANHKNPMPASGNNSS